MMPHLMGALILEVTVKVTANFTYLCQLNFLLWGWTKIV